MYVSIVVVVVVVTGAGQSPYSPYSYVVMVVVVVVISPSLSVHSDCTAKFYSILVAIKRGSFFCSAAALQPGRHTENILYHIHTHPNVPGRPININFTSLCA